MMRLFKCSRIQKIIYHKSKKRTLVAAVASAGLLFVTTFALLKTQSVTPVAGVGKAGGDDHRWITNPLKIENRNLLSEKSYASNPWLQFPRSDILFERANTLAKSGILIIKNQDESVNKQSQFQEKSLLISNFVAEEVPTFPTEDNDNLHSGRFSTWPECMCGKSPSAGEAECSPMQVPVHTLHMGTEAGGSCSWRAWYQSSDKVISVSLFGPTRNYLINLKALVVGSTKHYPGWSVWVYQRHPKPSEICNLLDTAPHVFFCDTRVLPALGDLKRTTPLMWQMSPLGDPRVEVLFLRHLSMSPLAREASAITDWLQSNKSWHVMRDHPEHTLPIEGGLWSVRWLPHHRLQMAALRNVLLARTPVGLSTKQINNFVSGAVWPHMVHSQSLLVRDAYHCTHAPPGTQNSPWPTRRVGNSYVGMSSGQEEKLPDCPTRCRPGEHQDWGTC